VHHAQHRPTVKRGDHGRDYSHRCAHWQGAGRLSAQSCHLFTHREAGCLRVVVHPSHIGRQAVCASLCTSLTHREAGCLGGIPWCITLSGTRVYTSLYASLPLFVGGYPPCTSLHTRFTVGRYCSMPHVHTFSQEREKGGLFSPHYPFHCWAREEASQDPFHCWAREEASQDPKKRRIWAILASRDPKKERNMGHSSLPGPEERRNMGHYSLPGP